MSVYGFIPAWLRLVIAVAVGVAASVETFKSFRSADVPRLVLFLAMTVIMVGYAAITISYSDALVALVIVAFSIALIDVAYVAAKRGMWLSVVKLTAILILWALLFLAVWLLYRH